ncbi:MAG: penicillin-binding transpeptidase domain-containing protein [Chloroflexota bacterium]
MNEHTNPDTSLLATRLLRTSAIVIFLAIVVRLYTLQILQGDIYRAEADENRLREIGIPAPRGIIYDRGGEVLVRNRPAFQISIVPEDIPFDDLLTPDVDEEALEIERILLVLRVHERTDVALNLAELMFRRLQRRDYTSAVESVDITLKTNPIANPEFNAEEADIDPLQIDPASDCGGPSDPWCQIPDLSVALPLPALVAVVQKAVEIGRLGGSAEPILLLDSVDRIQAFLISEESYRLQGLLINEIPVREYPHGELVSHIVGFMGPIPAVLADDYAENGYKDPNERVGLSGLEFSYQTELRGVPGQQNMVVDILGREQGIQGEETFPVAGRSLYLSLELPLQKRMDELLRSMMEEQNAPWGVTIAMDPMSGSILGMVSLPSFDNNVFAERIAEEYLALQDDERKPLINYAIGGLYPPGSVFKMVTATAALQEGVISSQDIIRDDGPIYLPNRFAPDDLSLAQEFISWNHDLGINHGPLNIAQALALSNDIYFYLIGGGFPPPNQIDGLGDRRIARYSELFGYGDQTGVDLPGEVAGLVPDDQWKRQTRAESWTTGDSYNLSIGQGDLLSTPLQVLVATAAVANGGTVLQPRLVHHITDVDGRVIQDYEPVVSRQLPVDDAVLDVVRLGMWSAVNSDFGTAIAGRIDGLEVAGKTGTAEFCEWDPDEGDCRYRDEDDRLPSHAWYVAYAPYESPEIIVVTFVYRGGQGSDVALPVTTEILRTYFEIAVSEDASAEDAGNDGIVPNE